MSYDFSAFNPDPETKPKAKPKPKPAKKAVQQAAKEAGFTSRQPKKTPTQSEIAGKVGKGKGTSRNGSSMVYSVRTSPLMLERLFKMRDDNGWSQARTLEEAIIALEEKLQNS